MNPSATPAAFAGVAVQTGSIPYNGGSADNAFSSITFNFYGQTQGVTESASATFPGATPYADVPPSTITVPYGCICTAISVFTTGQTPELQPYVSGITVTWTGLDGATTSQSIGYLANLQTINVQNLDGATVVPIGFFWYGLTTGAVNGGYYMANLGLIVGSYPTSVAYASLQSTGAVSTSEFSNQICGASVVATNATTLAQTITLTAPYSVLATQTVSDANTVGAATSPSVTSSTSFSQNILLTNSVTGATTAQIGVTATVSDTTALTVPSTTTVAETSTLQTTVDPGSSVQLVVYADVLTTPIPFSASGPATYTWYTFDGGTTSKDLNATVTFSAYQTTTGTASSVVAVS